MIEVQNLTKRYGERVAVEDLSFVVEPGVVTGFLGPNGAGKSTTMRLILGLDAPSSGTALVGGRAYHEIPDPLREIGAMLEAHAIHTGRSARNHLRALAATHGIGDARVEEVIDLVGLGQVANKRVGTFSLGMGQRLGIASSLLGDPLTVVLDEPVNGLDPEGIRWVRELLRGLAAEGKTVFLSSHMMSEMALIAERLVVIGKGRLIADTSVEEFVEKASAGAPVQVRSPRAEDLRAALERMRADVDSVGDGELLVRGSTPGQIGDLAAELGIPLHGLTPQHISLEDAFMQITRTSVEFHTGSEKPELKVVA
ncbi:MAG TPA: ATP-binding cassette domain-containing protein [Solirubrobacteraceae bacterium]|nr:ATP-binding cassette domain-containing protein [Solirubrobacteraceae bacterium]